MTEVPFLRPRLVGKRFDNHAIPLEVLKDLAILEEFVVEVAKAMFLRDHSDRQRSPRGFTDGVALKLTGVEEGSAIPVITLFIATAALFPPENQKYFEKARDAIVDAIAASEQSQSVAGILPEKTLVYFDRLGRSLRTDEAIELVSTDRQTPARLTRETRRRLLVSSNLKEITDETTIRGTIPEADQDDMSFEIQLHDGRKIKAPLPVEHLEPIVRAFSGYQQGQRVAIKGIGRFNLAERLLGLESVEHVTLLDPLDVPARLDEIGALTDGWLDGSGKPPSRAGIVWLSEAFTASYPEELPLPYVYPTPDGGVRFEWSLGEVEASLDLDLATQRAEWHQLHRHTDQDAEATLDLSNAVGWEDLSNRVQELAGAVA